MRTVIGGGLSGLTAAHMLETGTRILTGLDAASYVDLEFGSGAECTNKMNAK